MLFVTHNKTSFNCSNNFNLFYLRLCSLSPRLISIVPDETFVVYVKYGSLIRMRVSAIKFNDSSQRYMYLYTKYPS